MRLSRFATLALLALCTTACEPLAPAIPAEPPQFSEHVASSGASVVRYDDTFQLTLYDAEKQLLAFHNFRNAFPACGTPVTQVRLAEVLDVMSGSDATLVNELFTAPETFIWVWHSTTGSVLAARCTTPIASGVGSLVYTDNDVYAFIGDRARANAFGFTAHGDLSAPDGTPYRYNGTYRLKWQPSSGAPDSRGNIVTNVMLVPRGS